MPKNETEVETPEQETTVEQEESGTPEVTEEKTVDSEPSGDAADGDSKSESDSEDKSSDEDSKAAGAVEQPPAFTPNFKFTVLDKQYEIDESLRAAVRDEATQAKLIELHQKAYGLDFVKERHKKAVDELSTYKSRESKIKEALKRRDFDTYFQETGTRKEDVLQWVADEVQYHQLPPEERARVDAQRAADQRAWMAEQQVTQAQNQVWEAQVASLRREMDFVFSQDHVKQFEAQFDARVGRQGAFRQEIVNRGDQQYLLKKQVTPVSQLANEVMSLYGQPAHMGATMTPVGTKTPTQTQPKKVLPNIRGKAASPVSGSPTSLADLRKIAAQKGAI